MHDFMKKQQPNDLFFFALKGQFTPNIELTDFSLFIHQDNSSTSWSDWEKSAVEMFLPLGCLNPVA